MDIIKRILAWRGENPKMVFAFLAPALIALSVIILMWMGVFDDCGDIQWGQVRDYVHTVSYLFAIIGVGLGLHYASQRTGAMLRGNELTAQNNELTAQNIAAALKSNDLAHTSNELTAQSNKFNAQKAQSDIFNEAQKSLQSQSIEARLAGIKTIEQLGCDKNCSFYEQAISLLSSFLVTNEKSDPLLPRQGPDSRKEVFAGFLAICAIENAHVGNSKYLVDRINLDTINLSGFQIRSRLIVRNIQSNYGDFSEVKMPQAEFHNVQLLHVNINSADLSNTKFFHPCSLRFDNAAGADISGADFSDLYKNIRIHDLTNANYRHDNPPKGLPQGSWLGAPFDSQSGNGIRLTEEKVDEFWGKLDNDKYRPRDQDNNPIKIIYADDPDDPFPF